MNTKELTRAEEQVMQCLWRIKKGFLADIVEQFPEPRPAYTTIATVIRVMVRKKFIGFNSYGKTNEYYPLISKEEYSKFQVRSLVDSFFNGSTSSFASAFTKESDMSLKEMEDLKELIEKRIKEFKKLN
jgi:BlaI family transcriptional regulator, penicillinase repressor